MYFCARKTLKIRNSRKMKTIYNRIILLAATLMMSLSASALYSYRETVKVDGIYYQIYFDEITSPYAWPIGKDNNGGFPYDYSYSGDITIPSSITYEVGHTWSGDDKYQNKKVTFPVLYINWGVFRRCSDVTSVTLPNSVLEIKSGSFEWSELSSVTIPATAENIEWGAFDRCENLTSVTNLSYYPQDINWGMSVFEVYGDLHVLKGRKEAYQNAPEWKKFNIIDDVEITPAMVTEIIDAIGTIKVYTQGLFLIANARACFEALSEEQQAQVKNIDHLVEAEEVFSAFLPSGIADISADISVNNGKYLENGKLVIVKDGKKFNVSGLRK